MKAVILEGSPQEVGQALKEMGISSGEAVVTSKEIEAPPEKIAEEEEEWMPMPTDVGRAFLTRIPLAPLQKKTILKIYRAGDKGIMGNELAETLKYSSAQFRGMMGAFGRRMVHTDGFVEGMYFFDQEWIDNVGYRYRLPETSQAAVEAELL